MEDRVREMAAKPEVAAARAATSEFKGEK